MSGLHQFVFVEVAGYLPGDCLSCFAMVNRGCHCIARQELQHRFRTSTKKQDPAIQAAIAALPQWAVIFLNRWERHCCDSFRCVLSHSRRVSIPGMEFTQPDVVWGVFFPPTKEIVSFHLRKIYGDPAADAPYAAVGLGHSDHYRYVFTFSVIVPIAMGAVSYVTCAISFDEAGYVRGVYWAIDVEAEAAYVLQPLDTQKEIILSSHPTIFPNLRLVNTEAKVLTSVQVPQRFHLSLPMFRRRSPSEFTNDLLRWCDSEKSTQQLIRHFADEWLNPIATEVELTCPSLCQIVEMQDTMTTPKGTMQYLTGEVKLRKVDAVALWKRKAESQMQLMQRSLDRGFHNVLVGGYLPTASLLNLFYEDFGSSMLTPGEIYLQ